MNNFTIYEIRNKINNKIYIGQTSQEFSKRISSHKSVIKNKNIKTHLVMAFRKYGYENFKIKKILICENKEWADYYEHSLIKINKSNIREFGYNLTLGGGGSLGYSPSDETKKKISNTLTGKYSGEKAYWYGKKLSSEHIKKASEGRAGYRHSSKYKEELRIRMLNNNHMSGKKHSDETKQKMSENHADISGEKNPRYLKNIKNEDIVKLFNEGYLINHIAKMYGVSFCTIKRRLQDES